MADQDLITEVQDFLKLSADAESANRAEALNDLNFVAGEQWPAELQNSRQLEARPCLTINKLDPFCRQVVNNMRQQRPRMKVHPTNGLATKKIAELIQGVFRHIEYRSSAGVAYDTAADFQVKGGLGYWRVDWQYEREDSMNKEILIRTVDNPFTVYFDPNSTALDGSDAERCIVTDVMSKDAFKSKYPDADDGSNFVSRGTGDSSAEWVTKEDIRIAEYFKMDKTAATLVQLTDGHVLWADQLTKYKQLMFRLGIGIKGERKSHKRIVKWCKVTAMEVLKEELWPGRWIPIIPCYGNISILNGKRKIFGMVRFGKDPQRMVNYWETAMTESIALAPKAKWSMPEGMDEGHENEWARANQSAFPYLRWKPVLSPNGADMPGPERLQPEPPPVGVLQAMSNATNNLREVLGVVDPAQRISGNVSGKALISEKQQSDNSTFHFYDNQTLSIGHTGRICLDLMPYIYSEEQEIRIIGDDGKPDVITINQKQTTAEGQVVNNNVTVGEYDVVMDSGQGYESKRQEALAALTPIMQNEEIFKVGGDIWVRNMDFSGSEALADRLAAANPLAQIDDKSDIPPQAQAKMKQQEQVIQQLQQELQQAGMELKYRGGIEKMRQDGETQRAHMSETVKAHDIETRAEGEHRDVAMQTHQKAQEAALDYKKAMDVEEIRAHLALLLSRIDERVTEKQAKQEAVENAV